MWQHGQLSEQIRPCRTLACCWDAKQATSKLEEDAAAAGEKGNIPSVTPHLGGKTYVLNLNLNLNDYVEVPRSLVLYDVGGGGGGWGEGGALIIKILQF